MGELNIKPLLLAASLLRFSARLAGDSSTCSTPPPSPLAKTPQAERYEQLLSKHSQLILEDKSQSLLASSCFLLQ